MKWIGQQIWDLASRFRDDVYFEDLAETTETRGLVVDADGKLSINPISGDEHATHVYENVRNDEGSTIPVGTPVYSKGEVGGSEKILVGIAKANDPTKMPAIGITNTELTTTGSTKDGLITLVGVYNTNISGFSGLSINNVVYVASGGGLTITKPTGVNLIQNVGIILKTNGSIIQGLQVTCVGRTNDVPTPLHVDHANQLLGIGTTSPAYTLDVDGVINTNSNYRQGGVKILGRESSNTVLEAGGDNDIIFETNNAEKVRVLSNGNVGIGTTSPTGLLSLNETPAASQAAPTLAFGDGDTGFYERFDDDIRVSIAGSGTWEFSDGAFGGVLAGNAILNNETATTTNPTVLPYRNDPNTGLGGSGSDVLSLIAGGVNGLNVISSGNVGIGTTSPSQGLHVVDGGILVSQFESSNNTTSQIQVTNSSGTDAYFGISGSRLVLSNNDYSADHFSMDSSGNVGIGTASPGYKLHVAGGGLQTTTATGNKIAYYNGDSINTYSSSGYKINNFNGNLTFTNSADDGDIIFQSDDGNGGVTTYFTLDGSLANGTATYTRWADNDVITLGNSQDCYFYHNATNTYLYNNTGDLIIQNVADDKDIIFKSDDGSGGSTAYLTLDGSLGFTTIQKKMRFADNIAVTLGAADDLSLFHNGTNSSITNAVGNLTIDTGHSDKDIIFKGTDGGADITALTLDMSDAGTAIFNHDIKIADDGIVKVGNSTDLYLSHDGTNSHIANATGDLKITQNADDKDIIFNCDDGSGGNTAYLTLDGSAGYTTVQKQIRFDDSVPAKFGTGNDLHIFHDGTDSLVDNYTGDLYFRQTADDKDIIFQSDDGSGGLETYFFLDGSSGRTVFPDSKYIVFGTDNNLFLTHNGTDSYIQNYTSGHLYIDQQVDDADIVLRSDDGSGGITPYLTLDGGLGWTVASKNIQFSDSIKASFGSSVDMIIQHNGTNSYIENATGNLEIINGQDDGDIIFKSDDGSGGLATYLTLDGSLVRTEAAKDILFLDDVAARFGNSGDLLLTHDGSNSYISNHSGGHLYIQQNLDDQDIILQCDDGSGGTTAYLTLDGSTTHSYFSAGNVGIGTTSPDASLEVASVSTDYVAKFSHNTGTGYAPGSILLEAGQSTNRGQGIFHYNTEANESWFTGVPYSTYSKKWIVANIGSETTFNPDVAQLTYALFTIDSDTGNVGIGTTSPASKLHVAGTVQVGVDDTGHDVKFFGATSGRYMLWDESDDSLNLTDSTYIKLGDSADLRLIHDGTTSKIQNFGGNLEIEQRVDDADLIFKSDDGSGGTETYFFLDGSSGHTTFPDSKILSFGNSQDLRINHDGSTASIFNTTGNLQIINYADDKDIIFQSDDGSGGVETYFYLDGSANVDGNPRTKFPDGSRLIFGSGDDLEIYHNSVDSWLRNNTGDFKIVNYADDKDIILYSDDGSGGVTAYLTLDGRAETVVIDKPLLINGAAIKASPNLYDNIIKLLPSDFVTNDDGGVTKFGIGYVDAAGSTYGMKPTNADTELYTFVSIPQGMKATHVDVFDKYNKGVIVYEAQINATTLTSKGTGNCNTQIDITDVNATATNFLAIQVTTTATSDRVFGGQVTIAAI